ncbi:MAG: lasso RiPP family leader peptide-containing protein [Acidobacteriota bacterium]|nr:lasso RiPP family leader peptide-containing protein [Acidobacteriota bacterium]
MKATNERESEYPSIERSTIKRAYVAPEVLEYGSVQKLTQSGNTVSANDGSTHRARRP